MKRSLAIASICFFFSLRLYGQSVLLAQKVPTDSKVFVAAPTNGLARLAAKHLRKWGYWNIVRHQKKADFTITFHVIKMADQQHASAYISNKQGETIYNVKEVNSFFSEFYIGNGLSKKRATVVKLIRKRIIAGNE